MLLKLYSPVTPPGTHWFLLAFTFSLRCNHLYEFSSTLIVVLCYFLFLNYLFTTAIPILFTQSTTLPTQHLTEVCSLKGHSLPLHQTYSSIPLSLLKCNQWSKYTDNIQHHPFNIQLQTHDNVWHSLHLRNTTHFPFLQVYSYSISRASSLASFPPLNTWFPLSPSLPLFLPSI